MRSQKMVSVLVMIPILALYSVDVSSGRVPDVGQVWKRFTQPRSKGPNNPDVNGWWEKAKSLFESGEESGTIIKSCGCWGYPPSQPPTTPRCESAHILAVSCTSPVCTYFSPTLSTYLWPGHRWQCE
jgi:hypothetical protein